MRSARSLQKVKHRPFLSVRLRSDDMHLGTTAQEWKGFTDKERFEHIGILRSHFISYIEYWAEKGLLTGRCIVDAGIYSDVIRHYYRDLGRITENILRNHDGAPRHPDDFKQKAIYAFWIRKLKPIAITAAIKDVYGDTGLWINEIIAIFIALTELDIIYQKQVAIEMPPELYHDLLYFFRYKSVSPHALYLILASMYRI